MVRVWYMNDTNEDQREPHMADPPVFLTLEELKEKTGAEYLKFDADNWETDKDYAELKRKRGYTYEDVCEISRESLPNYDERIKSFFTEHIHSDEEIRFVVAGSGYFDLRDINDKWIRVEVTKNDLLIVPAGIYHRFTLDRNNYIKVKRLFVGEPVWTPINRPVAEEHPARKDYIRQMASLNLITLEEMVEDRNALKAALRSSIETSEITETAKMEDREHKRKMAAPHHQDL